MIEIRLIPLIICIYLLVGFGRIWRYSKERNKYLAKQNMLSARKIELLEEITFILEHENT